MSEGKLLSIHNLIPDKDCQRIAKGLPNTDSVEISMRLVQERNKYEK